MDRGNRFTAIGFMLETHGGNRGFTLPESARLVGVSSARLRNWVRLGFLAPQAKLFDFPQVAFARHIRDSVRRGASLTTLRRRVERLRRWLPECSLAESARLEDRGRLLVRVSDKLVDVTGQTYFEFIGEDESPLAFEAERSARATADELFRAALACEDARDFCRAESLYRQAIALEPHDAVLHFNLGNTLWEQEHYADAVESYRNSLACDANFAEGWNNLALALARLSRFPDAVAALERALRLAPAYEAAKRNLDLFRRQAERDRPTLRLFAADES